MHHRRLFFVKELYLCTTISEVTLFISAMPLKNPIFGPWDSCLLSTAFNDTNVKSELYTVNDSYCTCIVFSNLGVYCV